MTSDTTRKSNFLAVAIIKERNNFFRDFDACDTSYENEDTYFPNVYLTLTNTKKKKLTKKKSFFL